MLSLARMDESRTHLGSVLQHPAEAQRKALLSSLSASLVLPAIAAPGAVAAVRKAARLALC